MEYYKLIENAAVWRKTRKSLQTAPQVSSKYLESIAKNWEVKQSVTR